MDGGGRQGAKESRKVRTFHLVREAGWMKTTLKVTTPETSIVDVSTHSPPWDRSESPTKQANISLVTHSIWLSLRDF